MERLQPQASRVHEMPLLSDSDDRAQLLLDYAKCYERRGSSDTWGATPTDIQSSLENQQKLIHTFARRFTVPYYLEDTHPSIISYMEGTFLDRFINRCIANDENYRRALSPIAFGESDNTVSTQQRQIEQLVAHGEASPAEILALQSIHGIGAIELASLTHPYGANIEYLDDMRRTVETSIKLFGGEVLDNPEEVFSISEVINGVDLDTVDPAKYHILTRAEKIKQREHLGGVTGILMTRKRTLGALPDGTMIRQRTSFILTAESGILNDDTLNELANAPDCDHWGREAIRAVSELDIVIKSLLDTDNFKMVLPVSTTTYAFNRERVEQINAAIESAVNDNYGTGMNGHVIHDKLRHLAASQLREVGMNGMNKNASIKPYMNVEGMAFFGEFNDARTLPIYLPDLDEM